MEFVRLKYANNKLINADIKEHREIITEYVEKKNYDYLGFIPILFSPSGKVLEVDLIFQKRVERAPRPVKMVAEKPVAAPKPVVAAEKPPVKPEPVKKPVKSAESNDLYNDRDLDLILNGGGDDLLGVGK